MKYAGIGARKTPADIQGWMTSFAQVAAGQFGLTLRSGAAQGADSAFETGCDAVGGNKEIFLPWKGFQNHSSTLYDIPPEAYVLAEEVYGDRWQHITPVSKKFMARDCMQVVGQTLDDPVDFVVCWTPDGCEREEQRTRKTGGTGQAIALADRLDIPVFNIQIGDAVKEELLSFIARCYLDE